MVNPYKKKYAGVAGIYDTYVNADYDLAFWLRKCKKAREVLELTAGTGRVTVPLAKAGVKVTALDISHELLASLRKKCREEKVSVETVEADMRKFGLGRKFPLIIMPFQSLSELVSHADHEATFRQVRAHLEEGGRFIVTIRNPAQQQALHSNKLQKVGEYSCPNSKNRLLFFMKRGYDSKTHVGTAYQLYKECNAIGKVVSKKAFMNKYYVFSNGEVEKLAKMAGFVVLKKYGSYSREPLGKNSQFAIYELGKK